MSSGERMSRAVESTGCEAKVEIDLALEVRTFGENTFVFATRNGKRVFAVKYRTFLGRALLLGFAYAASFALMFAIVKVGVRLTGGQ